MECVQGGQPRGAGVEVAGSRGGGGIILLKRLRPETCGMTGKWEGVWEEILGGNASQLALITDDGAEEGVGDGTTACGFGNGTP